MDYTPPGSSVHGISQAKILECAAISFSRGPSQTKDHTHVSCLAGGSFTTEHLVQHDNYILTKVRKMAQW